MMIVGLHQVSIRMTLTGDQRVSCKQSRVTSISIIFVILEKMEFDAAVAGLQRNVFYCVRIESRTRLLLRILFGIRIVAFAATR